MSQKRVTPVTPTPSPNRPVFEVAPPDKGQMIASIMMIADAVAAFYTGLVSGGVPEDTAVELTRGFIAGLPEMWKQAG